MIHVPGGTQQDGMRFHYAKQNEAQFNTYEFFYFWKLSFNIFGPWLNSINWKCGKKNHKYVGTTVISIFNFSFCSLLFFWFFYLSFCSLAAHWASSWRLFWTLSQAVNKSFSLGLVAVALFFSFGNVVFPWLFVIPSVMDWYLHIEEVYAYPSLCRLVLTGKTLHQ